MSETRSVDVERKREKEYPESETNKKLQGESEIIGDGEMHELSSITMEESFSGGTRRKAELES